MEILFLIFIAILPFYLRANPGKNLSQYRAEAREQFLAYKTTSGDVRFIFNGADAEIVKEDEDIGRSDGVGVGVVVSYSLTRFARNAAGEYFMFVSNQDSPPFFKHVAHSNAKIALGEAYVSPQ